MTKEELLEDVKQGDLVKIYTGSNEVFEGVVVDFGTSGLKINISGTSKSKRIMYERITEYDVEDASENAEPEEKVVYSEPEPLSVGIDSEEDDKEKNSPSAEPIDEKVKENVHIDREQIFANCNDTDSSEQIYAYWKEKLNSGQKQEVSRIQDILKYAKKVHEYTLDSDRVRRAIAEYKKLSADDAIFNVFIGVIYHEFKSFSDAVKYYISGGAFDSAFSLSVNQNINIDLLETALLAIKHNDEKGYIARWLCEYAVTHNDFSIINQLLRYSKTYTKEILVYWFSDKEEIRSLPNNDELYSEENIEYFKTACQEKAAALGISEVDDLDEASERTEAQSEEVNEEEEKLKGIISYYKKDGGYGSIKNINGGQIYFHIRQVKDVDLQRILATESNYKRRVIYQRGINFKGDIAADAIEIDHEYDEEIIEEYQHAGFLDDYSYYDRYGKIRSGNKTYNFLFDAIKDPLLYAEIMSRPFAVLDLEVMFNSKDHKNWNTGKSSKVAIDIVGKKKYTDSEIKEFIREKLISKEDVDEWLGVKEPKKTGFFREVMYEPLDPIGSQQRVQNTSTYTSPSTMSSTRIRPRIRQGEKEAIALLLPTNAMNPFASLKKNNTGQKYFQEAHRLMVGRKNTNGDIVGVNLEKAEELFIKAIQSSDQTASAVANLVNIYIKFGGDYIVKGLQLLESYGYLFPSDKLTNMRIQLIDKSGNYEALELILLSAIPNCVKKNTVWQFMAKLAGIYYKQEKWDAAIEWFGKSLDYLENNKNDFPQYDKLRNSNLRSFIIAVYCGGEKQKAIKVN